MSTAGNALPRLALVSREFPPAFGGGIGTYAASAAEALPAAGVEVHVITQAAPGCPALARPHPRLTVHRVPVSPGRGGWASAFLRFSAEAARIVGGLHRDGRVDVAEFAECEAAGLVHLLATPASRRCPTLVHLHTPAEVLMALGSLPPTGGEAAAGLRVATERLAAHAADALLSPSAFLSRWATEHWGLSSAPRVIPYPSRLPPQASVPAASDEPSQVVLFVGRLEARKGVEPLAHAWRSVLRQHPHAELRLAGADTGTGPEGTSMQRHLLWILRSGEAEGARRVRFLGALPPDALREQLDAADVCVVPSLWENFPNTCLEAMGRGKPVVVSDTGGMTEMIGDSAAGLAFASGDPDGLAKALGQLLAESPTRRAGRGRVARERLATLCDPARVANERMEHLRHVMDTFTGRAPAGTSAKRIRAAWLEIERVAQGGKVAAMLPPLPEPIRRWVHLGAAAAPCTSASCADSPAVEAKPKAAAEADVREHRAAFCEHRAGRDEALASSVPSPCKSGAALEGSGLQTQEVPALGCLRQPTPREGAAPRTRAPQEISSDASASQDRTRGVLGVTATTDQASAVFELKLALDGPWAVGGSPGGPLPAAGELTRLVAWARDHLPPSGPHTLAFRGDAAAALVPLLLCRDGFGWSLPGGLHLEADPCDATGPRRQEAGRLARALESASLRPDTAAVAVAAEAAALLFSEEPGGAQTPDGVNTTGRNAPAEPPGAAAALARALTRAFDAGHRRVALYGAGTHTRACGPALAEPEAELLCVIDDDRRRRGQRLFGFPVVPVDEARTLGLDAVILSSDSLEDRLWETTAPLRTAGVQVIRLYGGSPADRLEPGP